MGIFSAPEVSQKNVISHTVVDIVRNHLNSFIFTLFLTYVLCDLFHHLFAQILSYIFSAPEVSQKNVISHTVADLVGNHLNSFVFTLFLTYVLCDSFHHLLPKYYLTLS